MEYLDSNIVDCDHVEKDKGFCVCDGGPSLSILKEVQKAYEERLELILNSSNSNKLQMQVDLLRSWVKDLVDQNTLLAKTVEELEVEITSRLLLERRKNAEMVSELRAEATALRRRLALKDSDLRGLLEVLRRLREYDCYTTYDITFHEVTDSDIYGSEICKFKKLEQGDNFTRAWNHERRNNF